MVKSSGETGCPVSQCDRMIVGGGLTLFLPVSTEMPSALIFVCGEADSSGRHTTNYIVDT